MLDLSIAIMDVEVGRDVAVFGPCGTVNRLYPYVTIAPNTMKLGRFSLGGRGYQSA